MEKRIVENSNSDKLITCVYKMREIVNKMFCIIDENEPNIENINLDFEFNNLVTEYTELKSKYRDAIEVA